MSVAFTAAPGVGTPPRFTRRTFRRWFQRLLQHRANECPFQRTNPTYIYVNQATGNDANNGSSTSLAVKTLARAQALHDAVVSGPIMILLRMGDEWRETRTQVFPCNSSTTASFTLNPIPTADTERSNIPFIGMTVLLSNGDTAIVSAYNSATGVGTLTTPTGGVYAGAAYTSLTAQHVPLGLNLTKANTTLGYYRDNTTTTLRKPLITAWRAPYTAAGWTLTAGQMATYQRAETNRVSWVREERDEYQLYRKMGSIAEVEEVPGSWWQDVAAGLLYLHPIDNRNPTSATVNGQPSDGRLYEAVYWNAHNGIYMADVDGIRVDGIRVDGFGCYGGSNGTDPGGARAYGIKGIQSGTNACYIHDCESYYAMNHNIGVVALGTGGIATFDRCRYGWGSEIADVVSYAQNGGNELIVHECEALGGKLPAGRQPYTYGGSGGPLVVHSSGAPTVGLVVCWGNRNVPGQYQNTYGFVGGVQNPPTWTDPANCRVFNFHETFRCRNRTAMDANPTFYAISAQTANTVTITDPGSAFLRPAANAWVELWGGASPPEKIQVSSYASGTGIITFLSNLVGAGRTHVRVNVGPAGSSATLLGGNWSPQYCANVNCDIDHTLLFDQTPNGVRAMVLTTTRSLWVNSTLRFDFMQAETVHQFQRGRALFNAGAAAVMDAYFCRFHLRLGSRQVGSIDGVTGAGAAPGVATAINIQGSLLTAELLGTGAAFLPGWGNVVGNQVGNGYFAAFINTHNRTGTTGWSNDPYALELNGNIGFGQPKRGSDLQLPGDAQILLWGEPLEYDADWQLRGSQPYRGPYEPLALAETADDFVQTDLDTLLTRIDTTLSSRLATAGYTAPNNAGISAVQTAVAALPSAAQVAAAVDAPTVEEIAAAVPVAAPEDVAAAVWGADLLDLLVAGNAAEALTVVRERWAGKTRVLNGKLYIYSPADPEVALATLSLTPSGGPYTGQEPE